jgi:predicted dehydrogenase
MAQQLCARFPIQAYFDNIEDLLRQSHPDVIHITTPPQSHFNLAKLCLDAGCHVYVEKPFALSVEDARELIALANQKGLKITAGHDDQFSHVTRRMRTLVHSGYLGSDPVHMESYYCYELSSSYAAALLGDKQHWVRRLPGQLLHNIISHGIARIAEFLPGESPTVIAHGFTSKFLRNMGESELIDELRVIICGEDGTTAYFTFSSQMRPAIHEFRMYGTRNGILLDQDHEILLRLPGSRLPSYADKFVPPLRFAKQHLSNFGINMRTFLARDFHMKSGMKYLIEAFYRSITEDAPIPIPYREILLTGKIMDSIFRQVRTREPSRYMGEETGNLQSVC